MTKHFKDTVFTFIVVALTAIAASIFTAGCGSDAAGYDPGADTEDAPDDIPENHRPDDVSVSDDDESIAPSLQILFDNPSGANHIDDGTDDAETLCFTLLASDDVEVWNIRLQLEVLMSDDVDGGGLVNDTDNTVNYTDIKTVGNNRVFSGPYDLLQSGSDIVQERALNDLFLLEAMKSLSLCVHIDVRADSHAMNGDEIRVSLLPFVDGDLRFLDGTYFPIENIVSPPDIASTFIVHVHRDEDGDDSDSDETDEEPGDGDDSDSNNGDSHRKCGKGHLKDVGRGHELGNGRGHDCEDECSLVETEEVEAAMPTFSLTPLPSNILLDRTTVGARFTITADAIADAEILQLSFERYASNFGWIGIREIGTNSLLPEETTHVCINADCTGSRLTMNLDNALVIPAGTSKTYEILDLIWWGHAVSGSSRSIQLVFDQEESSSCDITEEDQKLLLGNDEALLIWSTPSLEGFHNGGGQPALDPQIQYAL